MTLNNIVSPRLFGASVLISAALLCSSQFAAAQFTQLGPKLVGTLPVGSSEQGYSVALSADARRPSWAVLLTTRKSGRYGSTPAAAASGPSWSTSWSASTRSEMANKAFPSRYPLTATPPSWAGHSTTTASGRRGSTPAAATY